MSAVTHRLDLLVSVLGTESAKASLQSLIGTLDRIVESNYKLTATVRVGEDAVKKFSGSISSVASQIEDYNSKVRENNRRITDISLTLRDGSKNVASWSGSVEQVRDSIANTVKAHEVWQNRLEEGINALQTLSSLATRVSITIFVLGLVVRQVRTATVSVAKAQEAYNEAVAKYGSSSVQAERALRSLRKAQADYQQALWQARMQAILFGINIADMVVQIYKTAVSFKGYIAATKLATAADSAHVAVLTVKNALLAFGIPLLIAAVSATAMYAWVNQQVTESMKNFADATDGVVSGGKAVENQLDRLQDVSSSLPKTWDEMVAEMTGALEYGLAGKARGLIESFVKSGVDKNKEIVELIVEEYNKLKEEIPKTYDDMLNEALRLERQGYSEEAKMLRASAERYKTESQTKLETLYKVWQYAFEQMSKGADINLLKVADILAEPLEAPELKNDLFMWSVNEIIESYPDIKDAHEAVRKYLEENPLTISVEGLENLDKAIQKYQELKKAKEEAGEAPVPTPPPTGEQPTPPIWLPPVLPFPPLVGLVGGKQFGGLVPITGLYRLEAGERVLPIGYSVRPIREREIIREGIRPSTLIVNIGEMRFEGRPLTEFDAKEHAEAIWREVRDLMDREMRRVWR